MSYALNQYSFVYFRFVFYIYLTYFGVCCPILYKDHIIDYLRKKAISISDFKYLWMYSRQLFLVWRVIKTSHPSSQPPNYPSITDLCQKIWLSESQAGQTVVNSPRVVTWEAVISFLVQYLDHNLPIYPSKTSSPQQQERNCFVNFPFSKFCFLLIKSLLWIDR